MSHRSRFCLALVSVMLLLSCGLERSNTEDEGGSVAGSEDKSADSYSPGYLFSDYLFTLPEPFVWADADTSEPEEDVHYVGPQPTLIGGMPELQASVRYPEEARRKGVEGRVFVRFVIGKHGRTEQAEVIWGGHPLLNKEALRVIRQSKWKPAVDEGEPVQTQTGLPVVFRLDSAKAE